MFSPPNSPHIDDWFRRLDAAWKRMPAEEQTRQREEVQQHLESLVTAKVAQGQPSEAAWNAALVQFGDPTQIGRKVYQEWRLGRTGFRADLTAIMFGFGLWAANYCLIQLLFMFTSKVYPQWQHTISFSVALGTLFYGGAILPYILIGRKYPIQALKAALFTYILSYLLSWVLVAQYYLRDNHSHFLVASVIHSLPLLPSRLIGLVMLAYLASVTKRGWYRPTWGDFKLTLPKPRLHMG